MTKQLRFYPITKLLVMLFFIFTLSTYPGFKYQYLITVAIFIFAIFLGVFKIFFKRFISSIFIICLSILLLQGLFFSGDTLIIKFWIFEIYKEAIMGAVLLISKIASIGSLFILFFCTTTTKDLVAALTNFGISKKATYVVLSTLQIIPAMQENLKKIVEAQSSRGLETTGNIIVRIKTFLPIFTPLVLASLESSGERVLTLESRAFSSKVKPTKLYIIKPRVHDYLISTAAVVLIFVYFYTKSMGVLPLWT